MASVWVVTKTSWTGGEPEAKDFTVEVFTSEDAAVRFIKTEEVRTRNQWDHPSYDYEEKPVRSS